MTTASRMSIRFAAGRPGGEGSSPTADRTTNQELFVQGEDGQQGQRAQDGDQRQVRARDAQQIAEQDVSEVNGVAATSREQGDAQRQTAGKDHADGGIFLDLPRLIAPIQIAGDAGDQRPAPAANRAGTPSPRPEG